MPVPLTALLINGSSTPDADPYPPDAQPHIFTFSDGNKIAIWRNVIDPVLFVRYAYYALRIGGTWRAPSTIQDWVFTGTNAHDVLTNASFVRQVGDTIFIWTLGGTSWSVIALPYVSGSTSIVHQTWRSPTYPGSASPPVGGFLTPLTSIAFASGEWDSTLSCWHIAFAYPVAGDTQTQPGVAVQRVILSADHTTVTQWGPNINRLFSGTTFTALKTAMASDNSKLYVSLADDSTSSILLFPITPTVSGYGWSQSQMESVYPVSCEHTIDFDNTTAAANLDFFIYRAPVGVSRTILTLKRTGTNVYTAPTTLASGIGNLATSLSRSRNVSTQETTLFYTSAGIYSSGEIYSVHRRASGVWDAPLLVAGGDNNGYTAPSVESKIDASNQAHLLLLYAGNALYEVPITGTSAPFAPTNVLPSGNVAATSLTPTISWAYQNQTSTDTQGAYEIQTITGRVGSASSTLSVGSSAGATSITVASGASFAIGDQISLLGDIAIIKAKVVNVLTITPLALSHLAGVSVATTGNVVVWRSGKIVSTASSALYAATSATGDPNYIPPIALAYGQLYAVQVRNWDLSIASGGLDQAGQFSGASNFTLYQAPTAVINSLLSNGVLTTISGQQVTSPVLGITFTLTSPGGSTLTGYSVAILAADGITVIQRNPTTGFSATSVASGSQVTGTYDYTAVLQTGKTYYIQVGVQDSRGLVSYSAPTAFSFTTFWPPPPSPANAGATVNPDLGIVELSWQNFSDNFIANGDMETTGVSQALFTGTFNNLLAWDTLTASSGLVAPSVAGGVLTLSTPQGGTGAALQSLFGASGGSVGGYNAFTAILRFRHNSAAQNGGGAAIAGTTFDLVFMYQDANNYYFLRVDTSHANGDVALYKVIAGAQSSLGVLYNISSLLTAATFYWVQLAVTRVGGNTHMEVRFFTDSSGSITATLVGGSPSLSTSDAAITHTGAIGLRASMGTGYGGTGPYSVALGGGSAYGLLVTGIVPLNWTTLDTASVSQPPTWFAAVTDTEPIAPGSLTTAPSTVLALYVPIGSTQNASGSWYSDSSSQITSPVGASIYTQSAMVRTALASGAAAALTLWGETGGIFSGSSDVLYLPQSQATYAQIVHSVTMPIGAVRGRVQFALIGKGYAAVDRVQVESGAVTTPQYRAHGLSVVATANIWRRPTGTAVWTLLSSGTLRSYLADFPPLGITFDYGIGTQSAQGGISPIVVVSGLVLSPKHMKYGVWINSIADPLNVCCALGGLDQVDSSTTLEKNTLSTMLVPHGRTKPITLFRIAKWWQTTGRRYFIESQDFGGTSIQYGSDVIAALDKLSDPGVVCLYRDIDGTTLYVVISLFKQMHLESETEWGAELDFRENDYHGPPVIV